MFLSWYRRIVRTQYCGRIPLTLRWSKKTRDFGLLLLSVCGRTNKETWKNSRRCTWMRMRDSIVLCLQRRRANSRNSSQSIKSNSIRWNQIDKDQYQETRHINRTLHIIHIVLQYPDHIYFQRQGIVNKITASNHFFNLRMELNVVQPYLPQLQFKSLLTYWCVADAAEWFFWELKSCRQNKQAQSPLGAVFITCNVERWDGGELKLSLKCRHHRWVDIKSCFGLIRS